MKKLLFTALGMGLVASAAQAQITSADFNAAPDFVENFAGGSTTGLWELGPTVVGVFPGAGVVDPPTFITTTPAGLGAITTADPVGSSDDGGVMMLGNDDADYGTHFGLTYVVASNSLANGTGEDFSTLVNYRVDAKIWILGTAEYTGGNTRWQVGPYFHEQGVSDLFKPSVYYNVSTTGGGPGVRHRALTEADANIPTTTALTNGDWRLMRVMVLGDDVSIGFDTNDDGTIDELDANEFVSGLTRDTAEGAEGTFGVFGVGNVSRDSHPLFVDSVEMYKEAVAASTENWSLYTY